MEHHLTGTGVCQPLLRGSGDIHGTCSEIKPQKRLIQLGVNLLQPCLGVVACVCLTGGVADIGVEHSVVL